MGPRCRPTLLLVEVTMLRDWPGCWCGWERAIAELEDQNEGETDGAPVHLPEGLANQRNLRDQVRRAMEEQKGRNSINLTDRDARS